MKFRPPTTDNVTPHGLRDRGDRLNPQRSSRTYWHLTLLRDRLERIIASELGPGEAILDYGCGNRPYAPLFHKTFARYVGADLPGNRAADLVIGPSGEVPVADEIFDCVLSSQVLEHVRCPAAYLREARRLLKPGGSLILSTHGIWPYHPDPDDFWRWTIDGLQLAIREAGFEILSVRSVLGPESVALQLWQDATHERLPASLRGVYVRFLQVCIGFIERRHRDKLTPDASVYVVHAKKSPVPVGVDQVEWPNAGRS